MCLKQELKLRSKNTNPKIKNLKITIFSNPAISSNPKNLIVSNQSKNTTQPIQTKKSQNRNNPSHLKRNPANPSHLKGNPANPPKANPDSVAMLPANELFFDGKLVPLQLSSVKRERAHPPENRIAHPPENHRPIVNPLARPD